MIELKIDRDRITELAPLRLETVLFGDTGPVSIVAPREEAFRKIAEEAQADLRQRTDAEAPLLDEEEFAGANGLPGNVIAVGHGANLNSDASLPPGSATRRKIGRVGC